MSAAGHSRHRGLSLWMDTVGDDLSPRPALRGDREVDVAIVGAGFTGLWSAYALLEREPSLRVLVVEREIAGFGASGRNGGWSSDLFPASWERVARIAGGLGAARAMHAGLVAGIDDIVRVTEAEGIDADLRRGGSLRLAMTPVQEDELREEAARSQHSDGELALQWLSPADAAARVNIPGARGATFTPHCARLHPARLVRGLARAVERRGGVILEGTPVVDVRPHRVFTASGTARATSVLLATEAYTATLPRLRRAVLPLYSLMIATAPLPEAAWAALGWRHGETVADGRHLLIYAQRTADDRIAFGGRGAPYHFGSQVLDGYDREAAVFAALEEALHELIPQTRGVPITHRWGGPIGVTRDWFPSVCFDARQGIGWARGYVGDGVTAANVAGRTLADLVLKRSTDLTALPWVDHHSRSWEPEPLRWIGVNLSVAAMRSADRVERRRGRPSWRARAVRRLQGH